MQKGRKGEGWRKPDKRDEIEECLECGRTDCSGICDRIRSMEAETKRTGKPEKEPKWRNSPGYRTRDDLLAEIERLKAGGSGTAAGGDLRELEELRRENERLRRENEGLRRENERLRRENDGLRRENERLRRENEGLRMRIPLDRNARFRIRDRATGTAYEGTKAELQETMGKGKNEITDMIRHLMKYELEVL